MNQTCCAESYSLLSVVGRRKMPTKTAFRIMQSIGQLIRSMSRRDRIDNAKCTAMIPRIDFNDFNSGARCGRCAQRFRGDMRARRAHGESLGEARRVGATCGTESVG